MTVMRFEASGRRLRADFSRPRSIAIPLDFSGPQPSCFGAPPATARPLFEAASVRCEQLTLAAHCNGTHTECVGHVTDDRIDVTERLPGGLALALLVSVDTEEAGSTAESSDPLPDRGDLLVTARTVAAAAAGHGDLAPNAMILRTAPVGAGPMRSYDGAAPAPYLSREAAQWLVGRGILHLVLDLPSADRAEDGGRLTAHRVFFGLPAGSRRAGESQRPGATITELAWIEPAIADGFYLLDLQVPAFRSDAAPSRPLLYAVQGE